MMSLSELESGIRKTGEVSTELPIGKWVYIVDRLSEREDAIGARAVVVLLSIVCIVLVGLVLILVDPYLTGWTTKQAGFVILAISGALGGMYGISYAFCKENKLLRGYIKPVLLMLLEDCGENTPVKLILDLTRADKRDRLVGKVRISSRREKEYFSLTWFVGQTVLLDGCKLKWSVKDRVCKVTKRSRSGRFSFKYMTIRSTKIELGVYKKTKALVPSRYLERFETKLSSDEKRNYITVKNSVRFEHNKYLMNYSAPKPDPQTFVELLSFAFNHFAPIQQDRENASVSY